MWEGKGEREREIYIYIYIYIKRERGQREIEIERERERERERKDSEKERKEIVRREIERDICCRKGIWSPRGGDLVPQTLLAAEPGFLARVIHAKTTGANGGVLRDQIPPGPGTKSPPRPFVPKMALETVTEKARNHYFYSGFVLFGAFFSGSPKNTKKPSCRQCHYPTFFFWGGGFLYKIPFLVFV